MHALLLLPCLLLLLTVRCVVICLVLEQGYGGHLQARRQLVEFQSANQRILRDQKA
jgi:hypothetical protein